MIETPLALLRRACLPARSLRPHLAIVAPNRRAAPPDTAKEQSSEANRLPADVDDRSDSRAARPYAALQGDRRLDPDQQCEGKLQAEIAYIAYVRPTAMRPAAPSPSCSMAAPAPRRLICSSARWARGGCRSITITPSSAPAVVPNPKPGSTSPTSCSSIRSAPATAASSTRATKCASSSGRSMATSTCLRPSCANGSRRTDARPRRNSSPARATAASAHRSLPASSTTRA